LSDALNYFVTLSLKREEIRKQPTFDPLMDDDGKVILELFLLASNINKEVVGILNSFLTFLRIYEEKKTYNILLLMLDPRFKGLCLMSFDVGREQRIFIVEEYDAKTLYPMFLKCYHYLHLMGESEFSDATDHEDYDYRLDIFQTTASSNELQKKLMTKELLTLEKFM